jgi:hypothetical protein
MAPNEELYREHSATDLASLNRWLLVLLCALVRHTGSSDVTLSKDELDAIDKGWTLDYLYDDDTREVRLTVRKGPYTETYVVGPKATSWARADNPELERLKEPLRSASLSDAELAKMEKESHAEQMAREAEAAGWTTGRRLRPNP